MLQKLAKFVEVAMLSISIFINCFSFRPMKEEIKLLEIRRKKSSIYFSIKLSKLYVIVFRLNSRLIQNKKIHSPFYLTGTHFYIYRKQIHERRAAYIFLSNYQNCILVFRLNSRLIQNKKNSFSILLDRDSFLHLQKVDP